MLTEWLVRGAQNRKNVMILLRTITVIFEKHRESMSNNNSGNLDRILPVGCHHKARESIHSDHLTFPQVNLGKNKGILSVRIV